MNINIRTSIIHGMIALTGKWQKRGDACIGSGWTLNGNPFGIDMHRLLAIEASIVREQ